VLDFTWSGSASSARDEGSVRMGIAGSLPTTSSDDYPGVGSRTQSADGHFVNISTTIISAPEPASGALVAFGLLGLALRARRVREQRR